MENIAIPAILGTSLVFLVDLIRKTFPKLSNEWIKVITVGLSLLIGLALVLGRENPDIQKYVELSVTVLGVSQGIYALFWKDTTIHKSITNE